MLQRMVRVETDQAAILGEPRPNPVLLFVPVEGRGEILLPVLGPADAVPEFGGDRGDDHLFPAHDALEPEPATDVRCDHTDRPLRQPKRLCEPRS